MEIRKPRGTMDILPQEAAVWRIVEGKIHELARQFGFGEIRVPMFEVTELFARGVGGTTDIVQKEMYTFEDREHRSLTLRPEGTAGVARAVLENSLHAEPMPLKYYYLMSVFRYEKPQAGRSREFFQFGCEIFGAPSPAADAQVMCFARALYDGLGLTGITLHINSIGCDHDDCRPAYKRLLVDYFKANEASLCDTCRERLTTNPLRILDCKNESCIKLKAGAPKSFEHLCPDCAAHFASLRSILDTMGLEYVVDPLIVRGLDYYTKTVFEFIAFEGALGAQDTVCGGGRYDNLVAELGGPALCGLGFGMGLTRLMILYRAAHGEPTEPAPDIYIAPIGEAATARAQALCEQLRKLGIAARADIVGRSVKAQMKYADKLGAKYTVVLGDNELRQGRAALRRMADGEQTDVELEAGEIAGAMNI